MLDVEPAGQRYRNANGAVAGESSEAFVRWLHHRQSMCHNHSAMVLSCWEYLDAYQMVSFS